MKKDPVNDINDFLGETAAPSSPSSAPSSKPSAKGRAIMDDLEMEIYDETMQDHEMMIKHYLQMNVPSVLLVGESGVGKTWLINAACRELGLKAVCFNVPTMDTYIELVGVPEVVTGQQPDGVQRRTLEFVRRNNLDEANMIFLDELNRVSGDKQNALFELVHSRSINGIPLPHLKYVWGAMNTQTEDESRKVEELDDAFRGRWYAVIEVPANPKVHHYTNGKHKISEKIARALCRWWHKYLKPADKKGGMPLASFITPRVLDYVGFILQGVEDRYSNGEIDEAQYTKLLNGAVSHTLTSRDTKHIKIPTGSLIAILNEKEELALKQLRDDYDKIGETLNDIKSNAERATQVGTTFFEAIRKRVDQDRATLLPNELTNYSKALLALPKEDAAKVMNRTEVFRYFYSLFNPDKVPAGHKLSNKPTAQETQIYNKFKNEIDIAYTTSSKKL
jgi:hypothetical protein